MKETIIKEVEELDNNNLLNVFTHALCEDILKYLSIERDKLTNIQEIEERSRHYSDLILFLHTLKNKFSEKINIYKASLISHYEGNLFPILEKASRPLVLPDDVLLDIRNNVSFVEVSLIGFLDYQEQFVLSWFGQNDKCLDQLDKELNQKATKLRLKIQQYEHKLYKKQAASDKVALHINYTQRAIKDKKAMGLNTGELNESMEHYKLLENEISLQQVMDNKAVDEAPTIDSDGLKEYFISSFKGMGNGNLNNFDNLIEDLKHKRTMKEVAQIALLIHQSDKLNSRRPNTFAEWYRIFCKFTNNTYSPDYKPSNLKNIPDSLKKVFSYI